MSDGDSHLLSSSCPDCRARRMRGWPCGTLTIMLYEDWHMRAAPRRRANFSPADKDEEGTAAEPAPSAKGRVAGAKVFAVIVVAGVLILWIAFLLWLLVRVFFLWL
jgi:hypothetical protein